MLTSLFTHLILISKERMSMLARGTRILGWGSATPSIYIRNEDLSSFLDTSDEWIKSRVGISSRYICDKNESAVSLAHDAGTQAIRNSGLSVSDIELLIVATETPDKALPCAAALVAKALNLEKALAFDVRAACSGFLVSLATAEALLHSLQIRNALVIGTEALSRIIDWRDRNTAVLFGDGAGACVIQRDSEHESSCIEGSYLKTQSEGALLIERPGDPFPDFSCPLSENTEISGSPYVQMNGREVFKRGVQAMTESVRAVLEEAKYSLEDIRLFIPHQSNIRMIHAVCEALGFSDNSRLATNIEHRGNTSAASIPLTIAEYVENGKVERGDLILMTAVGSGMTYGSLLVRY